MAFNAINKHKENVYTLGPIIHNPQVVHKLEEQGVFQISSLDDIDKGLVILRSHGISSLTIFSEAEERGIEIVNATCPFVKKLQEYARMLIDEGYQVILVGDKKHPEVQAVVSQSGGEIIVGEKYDEIKGLITQRKIGIITQTTQRGNRFLDMAVRCIKDGKEIKIYNTICDATAIRQKEAESLAEKVDAMIIVGGRISANTTRLASICKGIIKDVYHIETAREIEAKWVKNAKIIGITGGASTPDWIIKEAIDCLKEIGGEVQNN